MPLLTRPALPVSSSMSSNWVIGCILSLVGSTLSNLGVNTQKLSMMRNAQKPEEEQVGYCKQPLWFLGFLGVIAGAVGDVAALSFAAQSIVAPMGSMTLVANIFFAYFWLKETLTKMDLLGTGLVISGAVLSVAFGNHDAPEYTMEDILAFYRTWGVAIYFVLVIALSSLCYYYARLLEPMRDDLLRHFVKFDEAKLCDDEDNMLVHKTCIAEIQAKYTPYEKIHPLAYCALSGTIGGQSVLMSKSVVTLLATSIGGNNQFGNVLVYVFLLAMIVTVVVQTHFLATALKYFDGTSRARLSFPIASRFLCSLWSLIVAGVCGQPSTSYRCSLASGSRCRPSAAPSSTRKWSPFRLCRPSCSRSGCA